MEMKKVPQAGYKIERLWISGLQRRLTLQNLLFPIKLIASGIAAKKIIRKFKPNAVAGFGGYASAPITRAAAKKNIPTLIQEQNSYAGLANKMLGSKARKVCVAYDGMDKYFPSDKIVKTGNPVRPDILKVDSFREEALKDYDLKETDKVILVIGGSLGARSINESIVSSIEKILSSDIVLIWQTGSFYYSEMKERLKDRDLSNVRMVEFIDKMNVTYAAADLIISRAGATSISELQIVGKPVVFVPSPNVAEDHQTKNAMALVDKEAAVIVKDRDAKDSLVDTAIGLLDDEQKMSELRQNIKSMGKPNATSDIVNQLEEIIR